MECPERQLWCAVVERALHDALNPGEGACGGQDWRRIHDDARRWFLRNNRDFRLVCDAAGYDPDVLRGRGRVRTAAAPVPDDSTPALRPPARGVWLGRGRSASLGPSAARRSTGRPSDSAAEGPISPGTRPASCREAPADAA
jgi:hypothetical protein